MPIKLRCSTIVYQSIHGNFQPFLDVSFFISSALKAHQASQGAMLLHDLPAVLAEDIILETARSRDLGLYAICRLREVNSTLVSAPLESQAKFLVFFEHVITKTIADLWFCRLTSDETRTMPECFRRRLISLFLGDRDRRLNELHSHLHMTCDYLTWYSRGFTRDYWLQMAQESLNRCELRDSKRLPLRLNGYDHKGKSSGQIRFSENGKKGIHGVPPLSTLRATGLMMAVLTEDHELLVTMFADGISPNTNCVYLGYRLDMACRLGLHDTVERLIVAGARDSVINMVPRALLSAMRSNQADIVDLLLTSPTLPDYKVEELYRAYAIAAAGHHQIIEHILNFNLWIGSLSAITSAARNGWDDLLIRKLEPGMYYPDKFRTAHRHRPSILYAAEGGHLSTCQLLLEHKIGSKHRLLELLIAVASGGNVEVLELFLRRGLIGDQYQDHVPVIAAKKGHIEMLEYALDHGYHSRLESTSAAALYFDRCDLSTPAWNC